MSSSNINDVANYLISDSKAGITHRELQKILYFSQGFYLSQHGEPLFNENMDAWQFGPVNGTIWGRFKRFGYQPLDVSADSSTATLSKRKKKFLTGILASFLVLGETMLIDMSHTDSPWEQNYIEGINKPIEKSEIEQYFNEFENYQQYIEIAQEKVEFSKLLNNRNRYLSSLKEIGNDWISGGAVAPSKDICTACKNFLNTFKRNFFSRHASPKIPKLVMGPIPTGGIGIELHLVEKNIYLHFHNNENVEVSIESNGKFEEREMPLDAFSEGVGLFLEEVA